MEIMVHAGGVEGWVEGADYNDEMNKQHYM